MPQGSHSDVDLAVGRHAVNARTIVNDVTCDEQTATSELSGVDRALALIRKMVLSGELLPGQKVHQADLAEQLRMSRIPVREALSKLHAEGVLVHKPNTGFTVARFSAEDLTEIYLMRRLLETELLRSMDLSVIDVGRMAALHEAMESASPLDAPEQYQQLNFDFHFTIFEASPLELVRQEVARLWYMSQYYRSLHLYEAETVSHLQQEHRRLIEHIAVRDRKGLTELMNQHRSGTERFVVQRLGRRRGR